MPWTSRNICASSHIIYSTDTPVTARASFSYSDICGNTLAQMDIPKRIAVSPSIPFPSFVTVYQTSASACAPKRGRYLYPSS